MLVYLAGNRVDLDNHMVSEKEAIECARSQKFDGFFETSAKTGLNISEIFETLSKHLYLVNKAKLDQFVKLIILIALERKRGNRYEC